MLIKTIKENHPKYIRVKWGENHGVCNVIIPSSSPSIRKHLKHKLKTVSMKLNEFPKIPHTIHICPLKAVSGLFHLRVYSNSCVGPRPYQVYFTTDSISTHMLAQGCTGSISPHIHITNMHTCIQHIQQESQRLQTHTIHSVLQYSEQTHPSLLTIK